MDTFRDLPADFRDPVTNVIRSNLPSARHHPKTVANLIIHSHRVKSHSMNTRRSSVRSQEVPLTRRALIIGITGQDGSYLAEHLLGQGY
jgi:hypothetical protein